MTVMRKYDLCTGAEREKLCKGPEADGTAERKSKVFVTTRGRAGGDQRV